MGFVRGDWSHSEGTHLVDEIVTTRREIEAKFGAPDSWDESEGDGKVTTEWIMVFDDGIVATIYDWKRYEEGAPGMDEVYSWHVGGRDGQAFDRVAEVLRGGK